MDIKVPEVGESILEAIVGEWHKENGASVQQDELLLELETDKVNLEVLAQASGTLEILVEEGETVEIGTLIGRIKEGAVEPEKKPEQTADTKESGSEKEPEPESKLDSESEKEPEPESKSDSESEKEPEKVEENAQVQVNPAAQKLAEERGIDLSTIKGSGRDGRILVDDIPAQTPPAEEKEPPAAPTAKAEPSTKPGNDRSERVPMTPIRKRIAEKLLSVRQRTAMLTTFNEIDMLRLIKLRKNHQEAFQRKHGVKLGFMSFFVKACAEALKDYPDVNARIDGSDIVYQHFYDIGIAVGGKRGLVVPIIRDADQLHFDETEKTILDFAERAGNNKLKLEELQGGTFTISNGGIYGSVLSTPLLNPPQSAILGMHAIQERAVVIDGEIVVRPIMNVALSYDHQIIDGRQAVGFLKQIKTYIEDPEEMLLEM